MCKARPLSQKQKLEIEKSRDEFVNRLRTSAWNASDHRAKETILINVSKTSNDWQFRLAMLASLEPDQSTRQAVNRAKLLIKPVQP